MKSRRPKQYTADIEGGYSFWLIAMAVVFACTLGASLIGYCFRESPAAVAEFNIAATEFNALPRTQREQLKPLCGGQSFDENGMIALKPEPSSIEDSVMLYLEAFAILAPIFASIFTLIVYAASHDSEYYLFDLPFGSPYGWLLFILMSPFCWPFFIGSYCIMRWEQHKDAVRTKAHTAQSTREQQDTAQSTDGQQADDHSIVEECMQELQGEEQAIIEQLLAEQTAVEQLIADGATSPYSLLQPDFDIEPTKQAFLNLQMRDYQQARNDLTTTTVAPGDLLVIASKVSNG